MCEAGEGITDGMILGLSRLPGPRNTTLNIICSLHLLQYVSTDLHGHHEVVVKIHANKSILGIGFPLTDTKYNNLVSW